MTNSRGMVGPAAFDALLLVPHPEAVGEGTQSDAQTHSHPHERTQNPPLREHGYCRSVGDRLEVRGYGSLLDHGGVSVSQLETGRRNLVGSLTIGVDSGRLSLS